MNLFLYWLVPTISLTFVVGLFRVRMWKRSISSFIAIIGFAVISNAMHYGYINLGLVLIPIFCLLLFVRGMLRDDTDKLFQLPHDNILKRRHTDV